MNRLTIGMATYRDFDGVYFTLQSLRAHHGTRFDVLVVDNAPERCVRTEQVTRAVGGRYVHRPDLVGTSPSREAVFRLAATPWVMCLDSHVLLEPGAVAAVLDYVESQPDSDNLLTGPMINDDGTVGGTHWQQTTPPGLWGTWAVDAAPLGAAGYPFEIPMQGLGCFAMGREAWVGFHPLSKGFGGEEGYLHEKVRRAGGRVYCLPQLCWRHRFRDVGGWDQNPTPYPAHLGDHVHNLLIQHRELGIEAEGVIYKDFGSRLSADEWSRVRTEAEAEQPFGQEARGPERQRMLGVWYTDNTAPPALLSASLGTIAEAARQCWRHDVTLVACGWDEPHGLPAGVKFVRFAGERKRSHATIVAQIRAALAAAAREYDVISFLEHDVLYPESYFQTVGDAFAANPNAPVVSNLDYVGLNAEGWQPVKERHEPMHQLSMRWDFAAANLARAAVDAQTTGSALLEPQGDRSNWIQLAAAEGLGLIPAVHVNHTHGRFTAHGEVVYGPALAATHPHWGKHSQWWPGDVRPLQVLPQSQPVRGGCGACSSKVNHSGLEFTSIDEWYQAAKTRPSDFHDHVETLKNLCDKCEVVSEISAWEKPSLVAMAACSAKEIRSHGPREQADWKRLRELCGGRLQTIVQPLDKHEVEETDLLFLDTSHNATVTLGQLTANAARVRKYFVIHTTDLFGEKGDDGGPGVRVGIRQFLHTHREWVVIRDDRLNYGLMVLSRCEEDRQERPGLIRKVANFAKATARHVADGSRVVADAVFEERLSLCLLCPHRAHDVCSKCGCPIDKKASWGSEQCPDDPPRWLRDSTVPSLP